MRLFRRNAARDETLKGLTRNTNAFRLILCLGTLAMLGLSWPLWAGADDFPRVPFVARLPELPGWMAWGVFGLACGAMGAAAFGVAWRTMLVLSMGALGLLVLEDQHRFQPWVYQYLLTALALAALPAGRGLAFSRLLIIALYFHSGLSKLDVSFCRELGKLFLETACRPLGLDPDRWPAPFRSAAILAMPAWALAVAVGLVFPRSRRPALAGAVAQHVALLAILGPWGLRHSAIVLLWNVLLVVEDLLLFGRPIPEQADVPASETPWAGATRIAFALAVLMPFGERWGVWDSWPSFALYASHVERTDILVHADDLGILPEALRRHVAQVGAGPWSRIDLTGWSRSERGVPVYPQGRACQGVAEALAKRYRGGHPIVVYLRSRAELWTGRRTEVICTGIAEIERQADRFRLNAHPRPWPRSSPSVSRLR